MYSMLHILLKAFEHWIIYIIVAWTLQVAHKSQDLLHHIHRQMEGQLHHHLYRQELLLRQPLYPYKRVYQSTTITFVQRSPAPGSPPALT